MGIGIFNAVTANTYATITSLSDGSSRKVLTEPLANYNIVVFDQQLKHNSSVYFINTNVSRPNTTYASSDVSGSGIRLDDAQNRYEFFTEGALSKYYNDINPLTIGNKPGYRYNASFSKIKGNFLFNAGRYVTDNTFNPNDIGYLQFNDFIKHQLVLQYNIYKPFGNFLKIYNTLTTSYSNNYTSGLMTKVVTNYNSYLILKNYFSFFYTAEAQPVTGRDYYEPRTAGIYYQNPAYRKHLRGYPSSDYRKPLAIDASIGALFNNFEGGERDYKFLLSPLVRTSDQFTFRHELSVEKDMNNVGLCSQRHQQQYYFWRCCNINTVSNTFTGKFLFTPNMNIQPESKTLLVVGTLQTLQNIGNHRTERRHAAGK